MSEQTSSSKNRIIIAAVVALLVGGLLGYLIGVKMTEDKNQTDLEQKITSLQEELNEAKEGVGDELQEGADAITEGQQTLESLQAENATLKATIEEQNQKIADLEKQLEEAQGSETPTN